MNRRSLLSLVPLVASLVLVGCQLDTKGLEKSIKDTAKEKGLKLTDVKCPKRPMKKGDTFDCTAQTPDDDEITFHVTQDDSAGGVSFKLQGTILDTEKVGDGIEEKVGAGADVSCPGKVTVLTEGKKIKCKVTIKKEEHTLEIKVKDDEGNVSWKIVD